MADTGNDTIRKITPGAMVTTLAGKAGQPGSVDGSGNAAQFRLNDLIGSGVAVDDAGNVYVGDSNNGTIRKITPTGVVTTLAGTAGYAGSADGTGAAARFYLPSGVAVDSAGNVFVADIYNNTIRKVTPAGVVTTLAGTPPPSEQSAPGGSADGTGAAAQFWDPSGVAVDSVGNVYVADTDNDTIRKITPAAVVTTLAGTPKVSGSVDGMGSAAHFGSPTGVAVDGLGNIYVADQTNRTIRKISSAGAVTTVAGTAGQSGSVDGTGGAALFNYPQGVAVDTLVSVVSNSATLTVNLPPTITTRLPRKPSPLGPT